jgi:hypothetical protein
MEGGSFTDKLIPPFLSEDCLLKEIYLKIIDISERKGNIMTKKKKYGKVQVKILNGFTHSFFRQSLYL